ncbi:MAG: tyrosine-protein phosphatase [Eubacterium sp.]|nr:tyrosine-protein phosphatase [Eubacterium sp.]
MRIRIPAFLLACSLMLSLFRPVTSAASTPVCPMLAKKIMDNGEVLLSSSISRLNKHKIHFCDVVKVELASVTLSLPVCKKTMDVNLRTPYIRFDKRSGHAYLSFNHGKFASVYGIKKNDSIRLQREKKNGYREEYKAHQYKITDRRKDYRSDAVFANFREIRTTGMARNILYRGCNPLGCYQFKNRPAFSAKLLKKRKIKTILNLENNTSEVLSYFRKKPYTTYYQKRYLKGTVYLGHVTVDMTSEQFGREIIPILRFMIEHPAPYYLHCNTGKDRTGLLCAILEALMGASYKEIIQDYMLSFENYYGVKKGSRQYQIIADGNIKALLSKTIISSNQDKVNPAEAAARYLKQFGMTDTEIHALKIRLSTTE